MIFNQRIFSKKHRTLSDPFLLNFIQILKSENNDWSLLNKTFERTDLNLLNNEIGKTNSPTHPTSISIDKYDQADAMKTVLVSLRIPTKIHGQAFVPSVGLT
ncbi:MAG: hypothetical protein O3C20_18925 [Verrucomicrobia bacterium]|nr:hypothetical protein [Verrucomicrobiota bacterium]